MVAPLATGLDLKRVVGDLDEGVADAELKLRVTRPAGGGRRGVGAVVARGQSSEDDDDEEDEVDALSLPLDALLPDALLPDELLADELLPPEAP